MTGLDEVVRLVRAGRRFLVTGHANPDGDALGSMLASLHGLRALGKEVVAYDRDPAPRRLAFLPGADALVTDAARRARRSTPPSCTTAATRTCSGEASPARAMTGPLIVLDHHRAATTSATCRCATSRAAAVGVIVARLLARSACRSTRPSPSACGARWSSDTGWFRYASTDAETMRLAAACVEAGAVPWDFARRSEESAPPARLKLMARVFDTLELVGASRAAHARRARR